MPLDWDSFDLLLLNALATGALLLGCAIAKSMLDGQPRTWRTAFAGGVLHMLILLGVTSLAIQGAVLGGVWAHRLLLTLNAM